MSRYNWILVVFACIFMAYFYSPQVYADKSPPKTVEQEYPGFASAILKEEKRCFGTWDFMQRRKS